MASELDRVLDESYLGALADRSMDDLRSMRAECQDIETGLSYLRRIAQSRVDIIATEARRRANGSVSEALEDLIARLPDILADSTKAGGTGRLPQSLGTGAVDVDLAAELDNVLGPIKIGLLHEIDAAELAGLADSLADIERRISESRRKLFDRLDALQGEMARRYRTGEADVETLLR